MKPTALLEEPEQSTLAYWRLPIVCTDCGARRRTARGLAKHRASARCGGRFE